MPDGVIERLQPRYRHFSSKLVAVALPSITFNLGVDLRAMVAD
jgi:hypothetical protein